MKQKWIRFGAGMLSLMLLIGLMGVPMEAGAAVVDSGRCGVNLKWTLTGDGILTISGKGKMTDYDSREAPWYDHADNIKRVVIENGVASIGDYAFSGFFNLKHISISGSVKTIGEMAFSYAAFTEITIPKGVTEIGRNAFYCCVELAEVNLPEGLTSIEDGAFTYCCRLNKINFPASITEIKEGTFHGAGFESITIPDHIRKIEMGAFCECPELKEIRFPEGLTTIEAITVAGCEKLETVYIPASVTKIEMTNFCVKYSLSDIYYGGTETDWKKITIEEDNDVLNEVTIHYQGHKHSYTKKVTAPTCESKGYTTYTCSCGDSYKADYVNAKGHSYQNGKCSVCGKNDPNWKKPNLPSGVTRLAGDNRFLTAIAVADQMKKELGVSKFDAIIVASGTNFADALAGSYLAAVKNAPILLSCNEDYNPKLVDKYNNILIEYIRNNLRSGGVIYILGGPKAVAPVLDEKLSGYTVKRLAGDNRYATNIAILEEAGVEGKDVLICNGEDFADSLSASATKLPILLVNSKYGIFDLQKPFLKSCNRDFFIIGGTSAVSSAVEKQIQKYGDTMRIGGKDRFETSVLIARKFFKNPDAAVLAYGWNFPDGLCGGSLAAAIDAPLILTKKNGESYAANYIDDKDISITFVLGSEKLISDASIQIIVNTQTQNRELSYPISEEDCYIIFENRYGYGMDEIKDTTVELSRSGLGTKECLIFAFYRKNSVTGGYNWAGSFTVYVNTGECVAEDGAFKAEEYYK